MFITELLLHLLLLVSDARLEAEDELGSMRIVATSSLSVVETYAKIKCTFFPQRGGRRTSKPVTRKHDSKFIFYRAWYFECMLVVS